MRFALTARILAAAALLSFVAIDVSARPGGGNSYSGSSTSGRSSSSSSSSSSSESSSSDSSSVSSAGPDQPYNPLYASLGNEVVGYVALLFLALFVVGWLFLPRTAEGEGLDVGGRASAPPATLERDDILRLVREHDPAFSLVLFEDFAYTLFVESQRARHDPRALKGLEPYWNAAELASLAARPPKGGVVTAVVVGSLRPTQAIDAGSRIGIECSFESNLHVRASGERDAVTQYVSESWTFTRNVDVKTRPWAGVRKLGCPSCGAPLGAGGDTRCPACGESCGEGRFDWQVTTITLHTLETRPHSLTGASEEVGTDAPTQFANFFRMKLEALFREDPALSAKSFEARLRLIFEILQSSWAAQDLRPLRPFVSGRQHDSLRYWIEAYQEQGLRNLMDGGGLEKFVFVRVERDAQYDAVTVRLWASGCDYTIDKSGSVVGGSRTAPRRYSEYWTLIRSARARGTPRLDHNCPGCGVALNLNMAGECEHCGAHVTSGEFDWVLSKIEQDEAYQG